DHRDPSADAPAHPGAHPAARPAVDGAGSAARREPHRDAPVRRGPALPAGAHARGAPRRAGPQGPCAPAVPRRAAGGRRRVRAHRPAALARGHHGARRRPAARGGPAREPHAHRGRAAGGAQPARRHRHLHAVRPRPHRRLADDHGRPARHPL
ncbi:MAG: hypothetical protein AVDCRST_MAG54-546, partial [uncultured Actinomycetospora sp.]